MSSFSGTGDSPLWTGDSKGTGDSPLFFQNADGTGDSPLSPRILIVAATGNEHKAGEFRDIIARVLTKGSFSLISQKTAAQIAGSRYVSPDETGTTFGENAYIKALSLEKYIFESPAFQKYSKEYKAVCVIADDSGLCVDALGGAPGIYSARYASEPGSFDDADDIKNVEKLLKNMKNVPEERRTARFECHISAILRFGGPRANSRVRIDTSGDLKGQIAHEMTGGGGFGYDPVLYLPERGKTTAMLTPEEKNEISHRGKALREAVRTIYGCVRKL